MRVLLDNLNWKVGDHGPWKKVRCTPDCVDSGLRPVEKGTPVEQVRRIPGAIWELPYAELGQNLIRSAEFQSRKQMRRVCRRICPGIVIGISVGLTTAVVLSIGILGIGVVRRSPR